MTGRQIRPVSALQRRIGQEVVAIGPRPPQPAFGWRAQRADDRYSRCVALLKRALPVLGVTLLVLVAVWPRLGPLLETVRLGLPIIDLREARELRMLNPRYAGVDRFNRPYVVTSAVGRQVPNRDDLMSLEQPRAEMTMHRGAVVVVTAATAMYQTQAQLLDLFGEVNLVHQNGTRFVTKTARVDVSASTAEGHDPVTGHGPSGDITAQGFRVLDKGNTVIFTGTSNLLLRGTKPSIDPDIKPPMLPAEVAETAAQIEAAALDRAAGADGVGKPLEAEALARSEAAADSEGLPGTDVKLPLPVAPPQAKAELDAK
jgi:lipopolysaccharide export system protein LptC